MSFAKCTFYPNFQHDASYCNALGTGATSGSNTVYYSRHVNFNEYTSGATAYLTGTSSDWNRCLPGPSSCSLNYFDSPCPSRFSLASREMLSTTTIDYCCERFTYIDTCSFTAVDYPEMNVEFILQDGTSSTKVDLTTDKPLPLCDNVSMSVNWSLTAFSLQVEQYCRQCTTNCSTLEFFEFINLPQSHDGACYQGNLFYTTSDASLHILSTNTYRGSIIFCFPADYRSENCHRIRYRPWLYSHSNRRMFLVAAHKKA
ncbi:hypothetical protein EJ04DRAFT_588428 [Polyplosphaeria fusca]|uniref:Uncharacterized protein n=1 Tax=Polyplosphaeria fusca TaxID=682080 RepID=A0A9P4QLN4_9PLEO|nr:hypothetical protein EJ04DRAFT_588428 [Polyplosphaeria fusca]